MTDHLVCIGQGKSAIPYGILPKGGISFYPAVAHQFPRHQGNVIGRGQMPLGVKAATVDELGVLHSKLLRPVVHPGYKDLLAACHGFGQRNGTVVGRGQHHAFEKLLYRHLLPFLQPHLAAAHGAGVSRCGDHIGQRQLPSIDGLGRQQQCHHLGDTGRRHGPMGILFVQHRAIRMHQQRRRRGKGQRLRRRRLQRHTGQGQQNKQTQNKTDQAFHGYPSSLSGYAGTGCTMTRPLLHFGGFSCTIE